MSQVLSVSDIADIARGAGILGTGGGGDPLIGRLMVEAAIAEGLTVELISPDELKDDALVIATAMMGAPSVVLEKLPSGDEALVSLRRLEQHIGRKADATIPMECGGLNSMIPLVVAARAGIPVVDADGMGRAFPELQMETFGVYGVPGSPLVVSNEHGQSAIIDTGHDNKQMEDFARAVTIKMGGAAYIAEYSMSGADVKRTAIPRTLSLARDIGVTVRTARQQHVDPLTALEAMLPTTLYGFCKVLMRGKVVDVHRSVDGGFTQGVITIDDFDSDSKMKVHFKNENLIAYRDGHVVALVPDLITIVHVDSGASINNEVVRYGHRVAVLGIATPEIMRTPEALAVFGPAAFGLEENWTPLEELLLTNG